MPVMPGAPPGAPPMPMAPPGGTGAASAPQAMAGSAVQAQNTVKAALKALQEALPGLPMGSDLHGAVLKAVTDLTKHMGESPNADNAGIIQQLAQLARQQQAAPQQAAAMRAMPPSALGAGAPAPAAA